MSIRQHQNECPPGPGFGAKICLYIVASFQLCLSPTPPSVGETTTMEKKPGRKPRHCCPPGREKLPTRTKPRTSLQLCLPINSGVIPTLPQSYTTFGRRNNNDGEEAWQEAPPLLPTRTRKTADQDQAQDFTTALFAYK